MRMIVSKVDYSNDITIVTGVTEIGSIKGIWKFNEFPVIGKAYLIELGIGELNKNQVSIAVSYTHLDVYKRQVQPWER